jgi:hypothetical protein
MLIFGDVEWKTSRIRIVMILSALWLGSAIFTDYLHGTELPLAMRGAARPIFLGASMFVAYQFLRPNPRAVAWFYLGHMLSNIISMYVFKPGAIDITEQLAGINITGKFESQGIGIIQAIVPCLLIWQGSQFPMLAGAVSAAFGLLCVFLGSRSAGGCMFVSGVAIIAAYRLLPVEAGRFRLTMRSMILLVLVGGIGVFGFSELYKTAAMKGWLGETASAKYFQQTQNRFGLLAGGRMEFVGGVLAVIDSPLIGHGSWPTDTKGFFLQATELANADMDPGTYEYLALGVSRIPSHSQILEAWVEHGFLAVLFWWYIIWLLVRCSLRGVFSQPDLFPAAVFLLMGKWWDMLFSPAGGRVALGFGFTFFLVLVELCEVPAGVAQGSVCGVVEINKHRAIGRTARRFGRHFRGSDPRKNE